MPAFLHFLFNTNPIYLFWYILRFQTYAGLSDEKVTSDTFRSAVELTLSDALGVPAHTSTEVGPDAMINTNTNTTTNTLSLIFSVNVSSSFRSDEVISRLKYSIHGGAFLESLSAATGDTITNTTIAIFVDASRSEPTSEASLADVAPSENHTGELLKLLISHADTLVLSSQPTPPCSLPPFTSHITSRHIIDNSGRYHCRLLRCCMPDSRCIGRLVQQLQGWKETETPFSAC